MLYRVVITKNGKKKKLVYEGKVKMKAKDIYFNTIDNNVTLCPKQNNAYKRVKPVIYEILFLKQRKDTDKGYSVKDENGNPVEVKITSGKWSIVHKSEYFIEEKFTVFGVGRMEAKDIIKDLLLKFDPSKDVVKHVTFVNNKIIIERYDDFDMIICKNSVDAKRLYYVLVEFCRINKIKTILFTGKILNKYKRPMYDRIVKKTGWSYNQVYRAVSRP
jgi:hypothetical protein